MSHNQTYNCQPSIKNERKKKEKEKQENNKRKSNKFKAEPRLNRQNVKQTKSSKPKLQIFFTFQTIQKPIIL